MPVSVKLDAPWADRGRAWDGAEAVAALREWATVDGELDEDRLAQGYVWRSDGPPSDWSLPVATAIDGELTLVWGGVTAAAGAVQGARSELKLPADAMAEVRGALERLYERASEVFDDDSIENAPWDRDDDADEDGSVGASLVASLSASALQRAVAGREWTPPAAWFAAPDGSQKELVSPEGRVSGYVAQWEDVDGEPMVHAGYAANGDVQRVPRGGSYGYFHQANVVLTLDDGSRVHPGLLTTDIGHGDASASADAQVAHYDNPRAAAAAVIVGEDDTGIWMAGAVLPDVMEDSARLTRLRMMPVSGHWVPTRLNRPMELIAVTAVPHPGFPQRTASDSYELAASIAAAAGFHAMLVPEGALERIEGKLDVLLAILSQDPDEETPEDAAPVEEFPEGVDAELVRAALAVLESGDLKAAMTLPPGVELPKCLSILADFLEGRGTSSQQSRAAAVKAAQDICKSPETVNSTVRARACRLVHEVKAKGGQ